MERAHGLMARPPGTCFRATWPAQAIAWSVGCFCVVLGVLWMADHVWAGRSVDDDAAIIAGSLLLRACTVVIALSSISAWGRRLPSSLVLTGLWGCAAAQLVYPIAELGAKTLAVVGLLDLPSRGIGNLTGVGWFNFAAVWVVFGIPGWLFVLAAISWRNRHGGFWAWPAVGLLAGSAMLFIIGLLIG